jgi:hypothetical protein
VLTPPGVLFLDSEAHGLVLRQWCHASLALPPVYALEQLREGAGTLQVDLDGLIQQLALGAPLLARSSAQLFQKLGAYLCLHNIDLLWRHSVYRLCLRLGALRSVHLDVFTPPDLVVESSTEESW